MCNTESKFCVWLSRYHGLLDAVACAFLCVNGALLVQQVTFQSIVIGVIIFIVAFVMGLSAFIRTTMIERTSFSKFWFRGVAYILFGLISIITTNVLTYIFGIITIVIGVAWLFLGCVMKLDSRPLFCDASSQVLTSDPAAQKGAVQQPAATYYQTPAGFQQQNPSIGASKDAAWSAAASGAYVPNPVIVSQPPPPSKVPDNPFA